MPTRTTPIVPHDIDAFNKSMREGWKQPGVMKPAKDTKALGIPLYASPKTRKKAPQRKRSKKN